MPLPIAHGLLGAAVVAAFHPTAVAERNWKLILWGAVLANCPDLDFLLLWGLHWPGVHWGFSHSLAFSLLVGCVIWLFIGKSRWKATLAYSLAFLSHTLLDFSTTKISGGVMLLWPFRREWYKLNLLSFSEYPEGFKALEMFRWCLIEAVIFLLIFMAVLLGRRWWSSGVRYNQGAI